jgi:hypothetical protein
MVPHTHTSVGVTGLDKLFKPALLFSSAKMMVFKYHGLKGR